jgi:cytochrome P450
LTILLNDELFKSEPEMIVDECVTFMVAATQTTQSLIANTLYYFIMKPEFPNKVRKELSEILFKTSQHNQANA